ncbi:MAG: hypothetical protein KGJ86_08975 [Chloroflexota bacterium]|nr:hypothetical protein [Chloroflexota bacterium]
MGVSEGTVRRDLKIAALAPQVRAAVENGASAKRLLEVERWKALEARSAARIKLERDTGRPSSELSRLLIELIERETEWEAGYSLQALNEARRRLRALPRGLRLRIRLLPVQSPIEVSRPHGALPSDGVDKLNYFVSWIVRLSFVCAAESEIRDKALWKAEQHFRQQHPRRFGQNVTEWS